MELKDLVALFRRWIWLLIFGLGLGLACGFVVSKIQSPVYEAAAKVLIARNRQQSGADLISLSDQQLVSTYQQLVKTEPFLTEAESRLGITLDPDKIKVEVILDTQIIQIKVQDKSAAQAASIANALVQILIEQNEILQAGRYSAYEEGLTSQITQVQGQIESLQNQITQINQANIEEQLAQVNQQITDLQAEISTLEADRANLLQNQSQITQLQSLLYLYQQIQTNLTFIGKPVQGGSGLDDPRITSLQSTLNLYQQLYLTLLDNLEAAKLARAQSTPTVTLIEPAALPKKPIRPIPLLYTALSGMVALFLAAGLILLMEYFDDTFKTTDKVQEVLHAPVIGQIMEVNGKHKSTGKSDRADVDEAQRLNAFGSLRINLSRLMASGSHKTILVTSAARGEGKTTVAVNLAEAFVKSGRKVVLVDADLYHPQVHERLGLQNETGLTDILTGSLDWQGAAIKQGSLTLLTSGASPSSLYGLLESNEMNLLLEKLQKKADAVIVDGPPLFVVDAQVLASKVGGVLLVIRQGETRVSAARSMVDQLGLAGANVLGVVLNRVPRRDTYHYGGYYQSANGKRPKPPVEKQEAHETTRTKSEAPIEKQEEPEKIGKKPKAMVEKQEGHEKTEASPG